ncbi:MAG: Crp/Fnr family transcriptional regulator [Clostridia bacterium]|nr:Crp/Fnr family transcriptional regulator [Clostridia bacterium]
MKKYANVLRACPLFLNIADDELFSMLTCFGATVHSYRKGDTILAEGSAARSVGIVLSGEVQMIRINYSGNRTILANVEEAELFGESYACAEIGQLPIDVMASENTSVMLIDVGRIMHPCSNACGFHNLIIYNLMKLIAAKNLVFHRKIEVTSGRTTREKLMTYLFAEAKKANSMSFTIPYDRQELADYLEVERSGLSAEISKLRKEGILTSEKKHFTLLSDDL